MHPPLWATGGKALVDRSWETNKIPARPQSTSPVLSLWALLLLFETFLVTCNHHKDTSLWNTLWGDNSSWVSHIPASLCSRSTGSVLLDSNQASVNSKQPWKTDSVCPGSRGQSSFLTSIRKITSPSEARVGWVC